MKILFAILVALVSVSAGANEEKKTANLERVKNFFPEGAYRKTSGGADCMDGELKWRGETLIFGVGANPVLIHSLDNPTQTEPSKNDTCVAKTSTDVSYKSNKKEESVKILQKVLQQNCGISDRTLSYELTGKKHNKKLQVTLTINEGTKPKPKTCTYEK